MSQRSSGEDRWVHDDWLGSSRFLTDSSGTNVPTGYRYDAFGAQTASMGPDATSQKFAGGWGYQSDVAGGLQQLGHRLYDPALGRFLSPDPIGFAGGMNRYAYVGHNPVGAVDPLGLCATGSNWNGDDDIPNSYGDWLRGANNNFWSDPMWAPGSPERIRFGNGVSNLPVIGAALGAYGAVTGYDPVGGRQVAGWERGLAAVGTAAWGGGFIAGRSRQLELPFDDLPPRIDPLQEHHFLPKYLGGDPMGPTVFWLRSVHETFHAELDNVFPRYAPRGTYHDLSPDLIKLRDEILEELYKRYP